MSRDVTPRARSRIQRSISLFCGSEQPDRDPFAVGREREVGVSPRRSRFADRHASSIDEQQAGILARARGAVRQDAIAGHREVAAGLAERHVLPIGTWSPVVRGRPASNGCASRVFSRGNTQEALGRVLDPSIGLPNWRTSFDPSFPSVTRPLAAGAAVRDVEEWLLAVGQKNGQPCAASPWAWSIRDAGLTFRPRPAWLRIESPTAAPSNRI